MAIRCPRVSRIFFTDNNFIFMEVYMASCNKLKDVSVMYEKASGQKVNLDKYAVCFGPNITEQAKLLV